MTSTFRPSSFSLKKSAEEMGFPVEEVREIEEEEDF
jgi:hypothetical protein